MDELQSTELVARSGTGKHSLRIRDYVQILGLTILVSLFLKSCVVEAYRIPSASMENTLRVGDFLLANKFIYGAQTPNRIPFTTISLPRFRFPALSNPQRGDIVVFELPEYAHDMNSGETTNYVKRCIALPGDTVFISNRRVFVNGREYEQPEEGKLSKQAIYPAGFGDPRIFPKGSKFNEDNYGPLAVPRCGDSLRLNADTFFLLRDIISHEGHTIRLDNQRRVLVDDRAMEYYTVEQNYFFMMGDNRTNSFDSRFWGFVPEDCIAAKVMIIYWSLDEARGPFLSNVRWERIGAIVR